MKRTCFFKQYWPAILVGLLLVLGGCIAKEQVVDQALAINSPVKPGLSVYYKYAFYRHLNQMATDEVMIAEGVAGQPIPMLNYQFKGNIFDSKKPKGVGVLLKGYLKIETPGRYHFKAMSNDGVRVTVNQQVVAFDPAVHSDRFSAVEEILLETPGWYPLTVNYYQRKGTARLELHWQPPGAVGFVIVPAEVYGHLDKVDQ